MSLFDDKKYESMDEISKMIEPWENPFDSIISKIPDEYEVPIEVLTIVIDSRNPEDQIIKLFLQEYITEQEYLVLRKYDFLCSTYKDGNHWVPGLIDVQFSQDFSLNFVKKEKTGYLKLVKTYKSIPEAILKTKIKRIAEQGILYRHSANFYTSSSLRTVYEIVTGEKYESKDGSKKSLINKTRNKILALIIEDRWRIRSYDLYIQLIKWFEDFCINGNSASIANIMKIKIMTHNGRAVYSIGEEK